MTLWPNKLIKLCNWKYEEKRGGESASEWESANEKQTEETERHSPTLIGEMRHIVTVYARMCSQVCITC